MIVSRTTFWKWSALMLLRPLCFLLFQVLLFGLPGRGVMTQARMYWPVPVILTNLVCFGVMLSTARSRKLDWRCYYLAPFSDNPGMAFLDRWKPFRALPAWVKYPLVFGVVFALLGRPALTLSGQLGSMVSTGSIPPDAAFPLWLRTAIIVLLPLGQVAAEIPWYNGLFFPVLERSVAWSGTGTLHRNTLAAYLVTAFGFSIQHAFMPLVPNSEVWLKGLVWLPVALMVGLVIRLFPRFSLPVVLVHGLMALGVGIR